VRSRHGVDGTTQSELAYQTETDIVVAAAGIEQRLRCRDRTASVAPGQAGGRASRASLAFEPARRWIAVFAAGQGPFARIADQVVQAERTGALGPGRRGVAAAIVAGQRIAAAGIAVGDISQGTQVAAGRRCSDVAPLLQGR
jgi:hypothetical protein